MDLPSHPELILILINVLCIILKVLLIPSYHSTDFEVHRNWLAITYTNPLKNWYLDESSTSIWTLDYPPFFAYFELFLSKFAVWFDPQIVNINNLNYNSFNCILFQRGSVICMDLIYSFAIYKFIFFNHEKNEHIKTRITTANILTYLLLIFHPGLLLIDHIHFQYNGMLIGILILICCAAQHNHYIGVAIGFSILILSKHIFLPLTPIFVIYLLRAYCDFDIFQYKIHLRKFLNLAGIACTALMVAFGPFLIQDNPKVQLQAIFTRLFPFQRGLTHAYWAPNIWAIYSSTDYLLYLIGYKLNIIKYKIVPAYISGIIGDHPFLVLPTISPLMSLIFVFLAIIPAIYTIYQYPTSKVLLKCVIYSTLSAFMFGYHVHEKAILVPLICTTLLLFASQKLQHLTLFMTTPAVISLFPLFTDKTELFTKVLLLYCYIYVLWIFLVDKLKITILRLWYFQQILCFLVVLFNELLYPLYFYNSTTNQYNYEFLPLMLISIICAIQLISCWLYSGYLLFVENH